MFFSTAFAQTAAGGGSDFQAQLIQFAPLIMIAGVFYFLLIRPQQTRQKEMKSMLAALKRGDRVITGGGIVGIVQKTKDNEVEVEIAPNVRVTVLRETISSVANPVAANDSKPVKA